MKKFTIFLIVVVVLLAAHEISLYINRQRIDWREGHVSQSPDKRWAVYIKSTSTFPEDSYAQIFVFKTVDYPNLKQEGAIPSKAQCNNPYASFLIPVPLRARATNFRWGPGNNVVEIAQGEINDIEPISYRLDLESFSLTRLEN